MGAGTFSQIYIQVVFAVKGRQSLISIDWEDDLYRYITGIVQNKGQKMLAINGMPDHIHFLIGMKPNCCLSDLVREVKKSSNAWVNDGKRCKFKFEWQQGYGAFSYGRSRLDNVIRYIMEQKEHHGKRTFREEYVEFLQKFEIPYDSSYLFEFLEHEHENPSGS